MPLPLLPLRFVDLPRSVFIALKVSCHCHLSSSRGCQHRALFQLPPTTSLPRPSVHTLCGGEGIEFLSIATSLTHSGGKSCEDAKLKDRICRIFSPSSYFFLSILSSLSLSSSPPSLSPSLSLSLSSLFFPSLRERTTSIHLESHLLLLLLFFFFRHVAS